MKYGILHIPTGNLVYAEFNNTVQNKTFEQEYESWLITDESTKESQEADPGEYLVDLYGFFLGTDFSNSVGKSNYFLVALQSKEKLKQIIKLKDFKEQLGLDINPEMDWDTLSKAITKNPQLLPSDSEFEVIQLADTTITMDINFANLVKQQRKEKKEEVAHF
jgi:hypothetical protein